MSHITSRIIILCLCVPAVSGVHVSVAQESRPVARKFDEFRPDVGGEELKIRCDNFAYYLMEDPGARGYIIFYRNRRSRPSAYHLVAHSYLTVQRGNIPNKIEAVSGGYRDQNTLERCVAKIF